MSNKSIWRSMTVLPLLALLGSTQAYADAVQVVTAVGNFIFVGAAQVVVPGTTSAPFANALGQRFLVTFSAECAVNAPAGNTTAWTDVDIVVLNPAGAVVATLAPTIGNVDAFCSADGSAGLSGWQANAVTAVSPAALPAGVYRAQVRARLNNGATQASYGERSLVVWR